LNTGNSITTLEDTQEVDGVDLPVYAINMNSFTIGNYVQGPWVCPHCEQLNVYRFYYYNSFFPFDVTCPGCLQDFSAPEPDFNDDYEEEDY
jgi:hypothetical protein